MNEDVAPPISAIPQRRVVLLHTTGQLTGLRRIMGLMEAETFPASLPDVNFHTHHAPCHLTRVEPRYVIYREQEPDVPNAPESSE